MKPADSQANLPAQDGTRATPPPTDTTRADRTWLPDADWLALHVPRFAGVRPAYCAYEAFLLEALREGCRRLAPTAIVEARTKALASFAEKILRKRSVYDNPRDPLPPDPLLRLTDLCGGRIIVQTSEQVRAVCSLVEEAFDIDWANSEDVSRRLSPQEFGYRSVHYIVIPNPAKLAAAGIATAVPEQALGKDAALAAAGVDGHPLKAEIQIRTLLEHAWSDLAHDLAYKTDYKLPDRLKRQFAGIAAVLEGADRDFSRLIAALNEFHCQAGAHAPADKLRAELDRLRLVLQADPQNRAVALRVARAARTAGNDREAVETLEPWRSEKDVEVRRLLGLSLTAMHWEQPQSAGYREGRAHLQAVADSSSADVETLGALAENFAHSDDEEKAMETFQRAVAVDPTEPVTLRRYLEFTIAHQSSDLAARVAEPMIRRAMERCHVQIEAGSNLPEAWASLAVFHLLLTKGDDKESLTEAHAALDATAHALALCQPPQGAPLSANRTPGSAPGDQAQVGLASPERAVNRLHETMRRLHGIRDRLTGLIWCERLLLVGRASRLRDSRALDELLGLASWGRAGATFLSTAAPPLILSGGCAPVAQPAIDALRKALMRAAEGLELQLISGGTTSGIAGMTGDLARASHGALRAYGYLPRSLPLGVREDRTGYARLVSTEAHDFSPLDPLQAWTDLIASGIAPESVRLLACAGGRITRMECAMALALGARVGIVDDACVPAERRTSDPAWKNAPNRIELPLDAMTLRAFLLVEALPLDTVSQRALEDAARRTHEIYLRSALPLDPSLSDWEKLAPDLKLSNYHQVAYAVHILQSAGLGVRPISEPASPPVELERLIDPGALRHLAEMEHGRWNIERLLRGWRWTSGPKDSRKHLHPALVAWDRLPSEVQKQDLQAIRNLPAVLHAAGLEVYRPGV